MPIVNNMNDIYTKKGEEQLESPLSTKWALSDKTMNNEKKGIPKIIRRPKDTKNPNTFNYHNVA